jgi:ATP-dependent DNA helicase PIF1
MSYQLSNEQKYAFDKFKKGENLFITGSGGTGKTKLIHDMVEYMDMRGIKYQVCAMTGCAAVLLGKCKARTLHSWSGIKLANGLPDKIVHSVLKNKYASKEWRSIKVLIVDEVSMMSKKIFDILDSIGKSIKSNPKPFGGIQIIFTGDFYQLPPVNKSNELESSQFCFESERWLSVFELKNHIELKTIFRQTDPIYIKILSQIRKGEIDKESIEILNKCVKREFISKEGIKPTKLFSVRNKTDFVNKSQYNKIEEPEFLFDMIIDTNYTIYIDNKKQISIEDMEICNRLTSIEKELQIEKLMDSRSILKKLSLKKGAVVMCTANIDMDNLICNGSQGIIVDFEIGTKLPIVLFSNGIKKKIEYEFFQSTDYPTICIGQIPLCLAWALTIHKIQGASLSIADMDLGNTIFEFGQTYVALSRVRTLDGLYLSAFNHNKIRANPIVKEFYSRIPELEVIDMKELEENIFKSFALVEEKYIDPTIKYIKL